MQSAQRRGCVHHDEERLPQRREGRARPKEFFDTALADFLKFVENLVENVLQLTQEMVDGVITDAGEILRLPATAGADIPVLSAILGRRSRASALTLIELLSFVIAIPVTLIYRVVEGSYPSATVTASGVQADAVVWQRVEGISSAINDLFWGIFNAVADAVIIALVGFDQRPATAHDPHQHQLGVCSRPFDLVRRATFWRRTFGTSSAPSLRLWCSCSM